MLVKPKPWRQSDLRLIVAKMASNVQMTSLASEPDNATSQGTFQQVEKRMPEFLKNAAHPWVCLFHILFKACAIVFYLVVSPIVFTTSSSDGYVNTFVVTTLIAAVDFWTTKNVTGRLLVNLRWWNDVKDDGSNEWIFESGDEQSVDVMDRWVSATV